jgi:hypothetical protein
LDLEEIGKGQLVRPKRRNNFIILQGVIRDKTVVLATPVAASYHPFIVEIRVLFQTSQSGISPRHIGTETGFSAITPVFPVSITPAVLHAHI